MRTFAFLLILPCILFIGCNNSHTSPSTETITPESQGISSQAILDFIQAAETERPDDLHSFILMRHGKKLAEGYWNPYNPESNHMLYSLSKSFTSTATGMAQAEGLLSINDPVISFFPEETPENPSENLQAMRIRDLLRMTTGHQNDALGPMLQNQESWVKGFLELPVEHKPGTHFVYNTAATFMLSAIIQKVTGENLVEYLTPRLFKPLGIDTPVWEQNMDGISFGGWGLNIRTKDIASFGQLYLQKGAWKGEQLIPAAWVEEATTLQTSNGSNPDSDWEHGYGYQFWRCKTGVYRGDGAFGQYCIVMPELDAVVAITSGTSDMQAIMNLVWEHLMPAMQEESLPENPSAYEALQEKLADLSLSVVEGDSTSYLENEIAEKTFAISDNNMGITAGVLNIDDREALVTFTVNGEKVTVPVGFGEMKRVAFPFPTENSISSLGEQKIATSAGWIAPDTLQVRSYLYETPYYFTFNLAFEGDEVTIQGKQNVAFGDTRLPVITGKPE
ncbi:MAG: serine hydrolase domain-containing protein [Bacteroidota bacterium]